MFNWSEFLSLAEGLGSGAQGTSVTLIRDEAAYRSAVSRAYYAAFCRAREYAIQHLGFRPSNTPSDHGRLASHYLVRGMLLIWQYLDDLRYWRNLCDYDDVVPDLSTKVEDALREAALVISML